MTDKDAEYAKLYADMKEIDDAINTAMKGKRSDVCIALLIEHVITIARAAGHSKDRIVDVIKTSRLWDAPEDDLTLVARTSKIDKKAKVTA